MIRKNDHLTLNNKVDLVRGDSILINVFLNIGTDSRPVQYQAQDTDVFFFSLYKPNHVFEQGVVKKVLTIENIDENGDLSILIEPEDTLNLHGGQYYWMVKMVHHEKDEDDVLVPNGSVDTIIRETSFYIYR